MCRKFSFLVSFVLVLGLVVIAQAAPIDVTEPGDPLMGIPDDGDWPGGEAPPLVIDNNPYTKYLHFKGDDQTTGFRVTPSLNAMVVTGMTFTTGNDAPERDPVAFEIYGSNGALDDDGSYVLIASGDIVDFGQVDPWPRNTKNATPVTFANAVAYAHYKVLFTALRVPANGCCMQISEVELLSTVPDLPPNVASMDIGTTHQGDAWEVGGVYTIRGDGGDIWGGADAFRYVFRPLTKTGDPAGKVMKLNLASMEVTNPWAKCGLMIRESLDPGAKHVMIITSGSNGVQIAARASTGGGTIEVSRFTGDGQLPGVQPKEMWIQRNGDDVICSFWNWVVYMPPMSIGQWEHVTVTVPMNEEVYVGMAVCSHDAGLLCTAVYEGPGIPAGPMLPPTPQPGSPVQWPSEPYDKAWLLKPEDGASRMPLTPTLSWIPGDSATECQVLLGTDPAALELVATKAVGDNSYTPDTPLESGTVYYWQIVSQPGEAGPIMSFKTERTGTGMID
jgi:hypothetical protein